MGAVYEGLTKQIKKNATPSTGFNPGDLVYNNSATHQALPASSKAYAASGGLLQTQIEFVAAWLGENLDLRLSNQTRVEEILIATTGRSTKTIASNGPYYVGQLFGPDGDGSHLLSQQIVAVASESAATHVLVQDCPASSTSVNVGILPTNLTYGC